MSISKSIPAHLAEAFAEDPYTWESKCGLKLHHNAAPTGRTVLQVYYLLVLRDKKKNLWGLKYGRSSAGAGVEDDLPWKGVPRDQLLPLAEVREIRRENTVIELYWEFA